LFQSETKGFLLIKGPYCFVFKDENAPAPKYAISLAHMVPRESSKGQVALETSLGDQEYIVTFDDGQVAPEFVSVVKKQASVGEQETVRKVRLAQFAGKIPKSTAHTHTSFSFLPCNTTSNSDWDMVR